MALARILFLADTHLGFDMPFRPRVKKRRRGPDFFSSYRKALEPALKGKVDAVIHGGDLLYRSRVPAELVVMALEPLKEVADAGIPVYLVPGNHERSEIPFGLLTKHPRLFVFNKPRTFTLRAGRMSIGLAGFPFVRHSVRAEFAQIVQRTGWKGHTVDSLLLCSHQAFEGATVGPVGYTFRKVPDVVDLRDIPPEFQAVLSGHIHKAQVLIHDLSGQVLPTPVLYPGSTERTSFAERDEEKGFLILTLELHHPGATPCLSWRFHPLITRPMRLIDIHAGGMDEGQLKSRLSDEIRRLPVDAVVMIRLQGLEGRANPAIRTSAIREIVPRTMNLSITVK